MGALPGSGRRALYDCVQTPFPLVAPLLPRCPAALPPATRCPATRHPPPCPTTCLPRPAGPRSAGIIRLGFGTGRFRRTKRIALWWVGERVAHLAKARLGPRRAATLARLEPYNLSFAAYRRADWTLERVIDKVRTSLGNTVDHEAGAAGPFSISSFVAALEEEVRGNEELWAWAQG